MRDELELCVRLLSFMLFVLACAWLERHWDQLVGWFP